MTTIENKFKMFAAPTKDDEFEARILQSGAGSNGKVWAKIAYYLNARSVMNRLDECFGPMNWEDSYTPISNNEKGFICTIKINCGNGQFITKQDGAENTDVEAVKGGISDSFKRCAVKLGFGRDLYELKDIFAEVSMDKKDGYTYAKTKDGKIFYWKAPAISTLLKKEVKPATTTKHPDSMPVVKKEVAQETLMSVAQKTQVILLKKEINTLKKLSNQESQFELDVLAKTLLTATYMDGLSMYKQFTKEVKELKGN